MSRVETVGAVFPGVICEIRNTDRKTGNNEKISITRESRRTTIYAALWMMTSFCLPESTRCKMNADRIGDTNYISCVSGNCEACTAGKMIGPLRPRIPPGWDEDKRGRRRGREGGGGHAHSLHTLVA